MLNYWRLFFKIKLKLKPQPKKGYEIFTNMVRNDPNLAQEFLLKIKNIQNSFKTFSILNEIFYNNFDFALMLPCTNNLNASYYIKILMDRETNISDKYKLFSRMINEFSTPQNLLSIFRDNKFNNNSHKINITSISAAYSKLIYSSFFDSNFIINISSDNTIWHVTKINTIGNGFPTIQSTYRDFYWKYRTAGTCSWVNLGISCIIEHIINTNNVCFNEGGSNYFVSGCAIMQCIMLGNIDSPLVKYNTCDERRMIGSYDFSVRYLNPIFCHTVVCISATDDVTHEENYFILDLSSPQFDIYSYNSDGMPLYLEKIDIKNNIHGKYLMSYNLIKNKDYLEILYSRDEVDFQKWEDIISQIKLKFV